MPSLRRWPDRREEWKAAPVCDGGQQRTAKPLTSTRVGSTETMRDVTTVGREQKADKVGPGDGHQTTDERAKRRRRVLIVAPHFVPSNLASVHRSRLFALHLREFGWEPIIVTVDHRWYE